MQVFDVTQPLQSSRLDLDRQLTIARLANPVSRNRPAERFFSILRLHGNQHCWLPLSLIERHRPLAFEQCRRIAARQILNIEIIVRVIAPPSGVSRPTARSCPFAARRPRLRRA